MRSKYGGLEATELKRIKELEQQLAEFKGIVADLTLENKGIPGKKALTHVKKRAAVHYLVHEEQLTVKQACSCVGMSRAFYYRKPKDKAIKDALRPFA